MLRRGVGVVLLLAAGVARAEAASVTVFLDRHGEVTDEGVEIPAFGGGDHVWNAVVSCVRGHYAPFDVDIVDTRPGRGHYITAVIGGRASLLGLDDRTTNGVGGYDGTVLRDQVVHVFSQVGSGERNVENLCAVTAHEVGHALGLDHEYYCGDIMSYFVDQCGARKFLDVDASCGESEARTCGSGDETQNSYRRLGQLVGFRNQPTPEPTVDDDDPPAEPQADPWAGAQPEPASDDDAPADPSDDSDVEAAPEDPYVTEQAPNPATQRRVTDDRPVHLSRHDLAKWQRYQHARRHHAAKHRRGNHRARRR